MLSKSVSCRFSTAASRGSGADRTAPSTRPRATDSSRRSSWVRARPRCSHHAANRRDRREVGEAGVRVPDVGGEELPEAPLRAFGGGEERRRSRPARRKAQTARTCIYGHLEECNAQRLSTSSLRRRLRLTLDDPVRPPHTRPIIPSSPSRGREPFSGESLSLLAHQRSSWKRSRFTSGPSRVRRAKIAPSTGSHREWSTRAESPSKSSGSMLSPVTSTRLHLSARSPWRRIQSRRNAT